MHCPTDHDLVERLFDSAPLGWQPVNLTRQIFHE